MLRPLLGLWWCGVVLVGLADGQTAVVNEGNSANAVKANQAAIAEQDLADGTDTVAVEPDRAADLGTDDQVAKPFDGQQGAPGRPTPAAGAPAPILDADSAKLSFQALLTDPAGVPLPGATVNLTFNIYAVGGAVALTPAVNMLNVPMANGVVNAQVPVDASIFDGSGLEMGVSVNAGAELSPRTPLTSVPFAFRVDRVASAELDDVIELGDVTTPGRLGVWGSFFGSLETIVLKGNSHRISTYGSDGLEQIRLWGESWGELDLHDGTDNNRTVTLSATANSGGQLTLTDATGDSEIFANGGDGTIQAEGDIQRVAAIGGTTLSKLSTNGPGGALRTYDSSGDQTVVIGTLGNQVGGFANIHMRSSIWPGVALRGGSTTSGGSISLLRGTNDTTFLLEASETGSDGAQLMMEEADGTVTVDIDAQEGAGAAMRLSDSGGDQNIIMDAQEGTAGGGVIYLYNDAHVNTIEIDAHEVDGASAIRLKDSGGITRITLDPQRTGGGRITTPVLRITGGADLSEQFDVRGNAKPGMVVCIDPANPGKLIVSHSRYDRTVAGIVSGAGDVKPGMLMGQDGSVADGQHPIALSGRVYVFADASNGPILPGDMLTTSDVAGHAMKVDDFARAHGTIIGKAMTSLAKGKGLVLVLVSLQ